MVRGTDATRSLATAKRIARALLSRLEASQNPHRAAELALLYAYLGDLSDLEDHKPVVVSLLHRAISLVARAPLPLHLQGVLGVAWVCSHLEGASAQTDSHAAIDDALLHELRSNPARLERYELLNGLVGVGLYLLERLPDARAAEILALLLDRLEDLSEVTTNGVRWFTPPALLSSNERRLSPYGHYALGMAHGVAGVVAFLARLSQTDVAVRRSTALLRAAAQDLARRATSERTPMYPRWAGPGVQPDFFFGWCWGDLGIATALYAAAGALRDSALRTTSLQVGLAAARVRTVPLRDASLCHGPAGHCHLFHRLYRATGLPPFRDAAIYWLSRALRWRRPGYPLAGYARREIDSAGRVTWDPDPSFLLGAAGIALALAAAATDREPHWDRLLLVSNDVTLHALP
ncbi:MAG: hypothetical protein OXG11_12665 [Chloroflexi bacterium]|nr:hypothetical protein [Chloroflexota bacterium]